MNPIILTIYNYDFGIFDYPIWIGRKLAFIFLSWLFPKHYSLEYRDY